MSRNLVYLFSKKFQLQALYIPRIQFSTKLLARMFTALTCLLLQIKLSDPRDTAKYWLV